MDDEHSDPLPLPTTSRNRGPRTASLISGHSSRTTSRSSSAHTDMDNMFGGSQNWGSMMEAGTSPSSERRARKRRRTDLRNEGDIEYDYEHDYEHMGPIMPGPSEPANNYNGWGATYPVYGHYDVPENLNAHPGEGSMLWPPTNQYSYMVGVPSSSTTANNAPHNFSPSVSSPSLARLLHSTNSPSSAKGKGKAVENGPREASSLIQPSSSSLYNALKEPSPAPPTSMATRPRDVSSKASEPTTEPLSEYTCPICFGAPTNATLTPCGHICCGSCLFAAVKTSLARNRGMPVPAHQRGGDDDPTVARCPVCRAAIPGWDGKGGGVIGLKIRAVLSL